MAVPWNKVFFIVTLICNSLLLISCDVQGDDSIVVEATNETVPLNPLLNITAYDGDGIRNPLLVWLQNLNFNGISPSKLPPTLTYAPTTCQACACGLTNENNRIVGGQETKVLQFPWMALLEYSGKFYCGGSLINDRYVLTAAHCVHNFNYLNIRVRLLEHDRNQPNEAPTIIKSISAIIKHKGYSPTNYNNDIALLRLDSPVEMTSVLRPVCMPTAGKSYTSYTGLVTGWGATMEHGSVSINLRYVNVPILSNIDCRKSGYSPVRITDNMMCAGYKEGQQDSCQGDSGGPMHVIENYKHSIVGVVSWGDGCAAPNYPGVYSRVNRYKTWIMSNTADACYCS